MNRLLPLRMAALLSVAICGITACGGPLAAQEAPDVGSLGVDPEYRVRVSTDADTVEGRWLLPSEGLLRIDTGDGVRTVAPERVVDVSVRTTRARRGTKVGATVGGIVTGTIGGYLGVVVGAYCAGRRCRSSDVVVYGLSGLAVGGAVGAVAGGTLGGILGSWSLTWRPVWP